MKLLNVLYEIRIYVSTLFAVHTMGFKHLSHHFILGFPQLSLKMNHIVFIHVVPCLPPVNINSQ